MKKARKARRKDQDPAVINPLIRRWTEEGDEEARDAVLNAHRVLVAWWAVRYSQMTDASADYDDLMQEGMLGVLRAMKGFDPVLGEFSWRATDWIRSFMVRWVMRNKGPVKNMPKDAARAGTIGVSLVQYHVMDGDEFELEFPSNEAPVPDRIEANQRASRVRRAVNELDLVDRFVLSALFLEGRTLKEIGELRGITKQRVKQLVDRALGRLVQTPTGKRLWEDA